MQINHPKTWAYIILLILMLTSVTLIVIHHHALQKEEQDLQQKIDNHSEIKDTV
jgi:uncharacterized protein YueI